MSETFDQGKDEVAKLCQYFKTNRQSFLAAKVKEAHIRQSLIDPFFEALGWDVRNASRIAPQYREVIPEDSLDVEGQQKAPDYTFRVGTLPKFYVEAKKCGVNISVDPAPAFQLRRYGFSAKLALSILTDFEELAVYDCASRPRPSDKASHARIQYFRFTEYPDRWREIWDVFSREAVWSGKFDEYAASKRKRGTSEVDIEFLKDIEGWRDVLAHNLALRNRDLTTDDLNVAIQRIIDRIVFLRMAEDRGLESYGKLLHLCEKKDIYSHFIRDLCRKADEKYNSGLFHFQKEPGVPEAPDRLTPKLTLDDKVLKPILQSLYFEHGCPYHFGVLPVEILGTVYERFLGKVIRLTAGHRAKVEEKPEVRKAGGVYYTPAYIVNYIVQNTIGKQIEGKSPAILAGDKKTPPFRVLDMACGSGSFLLGAYQFLLGHCLSWYQAHPSKKHAKAIYQNDKGEISLSIAERKRILTTHIFGVDIDRQAVETTKLSLLLKALEGESDATLSRQQLPFRERALPNLSGNIKCGNSLIASDFSMLPEELVRVRAFDWPAQFPEAMKAGGFDAVIGNPPWGGDIDKDLRYFHSKYPHTTQEHTDSFKLFIEKGLRLARHDGFVSMIVPNTILRQRRLKDVRSFLLNSTILTLADFGENVFKGVVAPSCVFVVANRNPDISHNTTIANLGKLSNEQKSEALRVGAQSDTVQQNFFCENPDLEFAASQRKPLASVVALGEFDELALKDAGINYQRVKVGMKEKGKSDLSQRLLYEGRQQKKRDKMYWKGTDIDRYWMVETTDRFCRTNYQDFIRANEVVHLNEKIYNTVPKIVFRQTADRIIATIDYRGTWFGRSIIALVLKPYSNYRIEYFLGILNSKYFQWMYDEIARETGRVFAQVKLSKMKQLLIRPINFTDFPDKEKHDKLVGLVEKMLALTPKLRAAKTESEKATLQNAITATDAAIDRLVYELYGLTEEEIKIVEGEC